MLSGLAVESGPGLTPAEGRAEADHAMAALRGAIAADWRDPDRLRVDPDLKPIRSRSDFQLLMMKMMAAAFPAGPFSKDTNANR